MIQIKNAAEIEKMRRACAISAAALKAGGEAIEAGISTAEIDKIIYDFIVRHGARPNFLHLYGFPATACISVNDTVIHGIPSRKVKIRPGDIVSIDTGCVIDGYNGDNACTYACGKVDSEAQRLMDVTKESLHRGIAAALAGNRTGDVGHAVQQYVEENGFSVVRTFVGHGVGKELHEEPEVPNYGNPGRGPRLVPGMCIAIEPMVNQKACAVKTLSDGWTVKTCDGGLAAHFEHTLAITPAGPEILTHGWEEPGWTL
ncbi:MAG: type I methionyl aminopeptidase [Gemmiger sp.]|nr:type I methionyl aminopeptidase [Gemmiger sp.]